MTNAQMLTRDLKKQLVTIDRQLTLIQLEIDEYERSDYSYIKDDVIMIRDELKDIERRMSRDKYFLYNRIKFLSNGEKE